MSVTVRRPDGRSGSDGAAGREGEMLVVIKLGKKIFGKSACLFFSSEF